MKKEKMKIFIASDHAGFLLKKRIKNFLSNYQVEDLGPSSYNKNDDYPDFAFKVAKKVSENKGYRGILICGTGAGMTIAANKVKGVRAVAAYDVYSAKYSRLHNNANILGLRGRNFPFDKIKKIISVWLKTEFSNVERHNRRIRKIKNYEKQKF